MSEVIQIEDLLPHRGALLLLNGWIESCEKSITTTVVVRDDGLFSRGKMVPAFIGLEYMAQTIAAYSGLRARLQGASPKIGFLLGTRNYKSTVGEIPCGTELSVHARVLTAGTNGMAAFRCKVNGTGILQSGTLSVYEPPNQEAFLREKQ